MSTKLNRDIQHFYDTLSSLWEETWGEHMHHGHYGNDGTETIDHYQAQIKLIEELLRWGKVRKPGRILDVGCGIGGSSLYLAKKFNAHVSGITLSPVQADRAIQRAEEANLQNQTYFQVADALNPPFSPGSFDLVWSLESGEHMPDKRRFLQACVEMLAPGGKLLIATWCHRDIPPELTQIEQRHLQKLYQAYNLPYIISIYEYADIAQEEDLESLDIADWTEAVSPFWPAVIRSAYRLSSIQGLVKAGWPAIRGALAMRLMIHGYRTGLVRFGLLQGTKRK